MSTKINHTFSLLVMLVLIHLALTAVVAQQTFERSQQIQTSSPTVTAATLGELVRVTAPSNITHLRLELFSAAGEKVFDSLLHDGNVLDWHWQDEKALQFSTDSYLCVVTVQSLSGKISRKLANVSFANQKAVLKPVNLTQLNLVQTQALGSTERDTPLTIIDGDQAI